ncbi:CCN family member 3-like [Denticeps clupeoides]|uniref:CCN family member 3 n=1 Tax=Denticeps clupeoides TaxID=299321 RepID=A0AAY4E5I0_9TELE|nr:CCN family member 3 [Denticeps clupeoides]
MEPLPLQHLVTFLPRGNDYKFLWRTLPQPSAEPQLSRSQTRPLQRTMARRNAFVFSACVQVALCVIAWAQACPSRCRCPPQPPVCGAGVPAVLDECACCLVCARQDGEVCSDLQPCDARRGLRCKYPAGARKRSGVCAAAAEGGVCILDGVVYQNGEAFFPSCSYQCVCRQGQLACVPRCNLDVMLPGPDCPFPVRVQVPGECCEKWACEPQPESSVLGGLAMAAYRQEETIGFDAWDPSVNCIEQTTEWGACSRTCGMGVSTRVTNKNRKCEMVKQSRLCMVRPCDMQKDRRTAVKGSACLRPKRSEKPFHFSFKNCTSVQAYQPRFCSLCGDGRCCTPHSTKTAQVQFRCPNDRTIKRPVMFVNSCACHRHCPTDNSVLPHLGPGYDAGLAH